MQFRRMKIEEASGDRRRLLESVLLQLEGANTDVAGTVGVNVLIQTILAECASLAEMDQFIDELAEAMRLGVRAQLDRMMADHGKLQ